MTHPAEERDERHDARVGLAMFAIAVLLCLAAAMSAWVISGWLS